MKKTLWRAADDDYVSQGYSFAESRDIAELYLDNPGFGGDKLWKSVVQFRRSQAIDLTDASVSEVAARLDENDPGAIGLEEWLPMFPDVLQKLREEGFLWALVAESYPEASTTWLWLGTSDDAEPELRPVELEG